jgi:hypothetical protein
MKKLIYGIAILPALILGGIGVSTVAQQGNALDAESRAYVDQVVPAIARHWDQNELLGHATPELLNVINPDQAAQLFAIFARLGKITKYRGATGEATMSLMLDSGTAVFASYVARADFDNGSATFRIGLRKLDGRWLINSFYVDLAPPGRSPKA